MADKGGVRIDVGLIQEVAKETKALQTELTDLGKPAMIEVLRCAGPNISPAQSTLLAKLVPKKQTSTDWVLGRFQRRPGTQYFLKGLIRIFDPQLFVIM